ncbi:MAG: hypothetical protein WA958_11820 [Tunicatimonas sp.]
MGQIQGFNCTLLREEANHTIYQNPANSQQSTIIENSLIHFAKRWANNSECRR